MQDMKSSGTKEQILGEIVSRLVVTCYRAQEFKKMALGVGIPQLFDSINSQRPSLWQLGWQLATVSATKVALQLQRVVSENGPLQVGMFGGH
jgi:hypothetical protein